MTTEPREISSKALREFLSEAEEIIERLNQNLLRLDRRGKGGHVDPETLNEIFRAAHSLKGLSAMFGLASMTSLAHQLEDILDRLRLGRIALSPSLLDLLFESLELLGRIVERTSGGSDADGGAESELMISRLQAAVSPRKEEAEVGLLDRLRIDPEILAVLTEYEEHRLAENIRQRMRIYKVHAKFDLVTFDQSLNELTTGLKLLGEVITTLPSANAAKETEIEFDILLGSERSDRELRAEMRPDVTVEELRYHERPGGGDDYPQRPAPEPAPPSALPAAAGPAREPEREEAEPQERESEEAPGSLKSITETVRVDIAKLDHLMNLVGELGLIRSNVARLGDRLKLDQGFTGHAVELHKVNKQLERKLAELQESVMDVRMVPVRQVFDKLSRVVRKISREMHRRVRLEMEGADVELDKLIIEGLVDPLMHIVRNSLDHGIEPASERIAAGKPEEGTIRIRAAQRGNHVVIDVTDDGRGIWPERILERAREKGLAPANAQLSRREILDLIFLPGFSTKQVVTEVSGRGIGMDVVKQNIGRLSGIIDIESEPGEGSTFSLVLPITLAIIQALIVEACGRLYAVPLNSVLECLTLKAADIKSIEQREVLQLRDAILPLLHLDRIFRLGREGEAPDKCFVVVVGLAEHRLGLVVDSLHDRQDIVIKSLGQGLQNVRGIAGATELGNQRTILVLDIGSLIEKSARRRE
jgi:two-component system chemotaxis sensor kinase CheA